MEDNPGDAELVSLYLENDSESKIKVEKAQSLAEAVRAIRKRSYKAVILDLGLPDSQGLQSLKGIQSVSEDLPIVVLSGICDLRISSEAVRIGAQEVLNKDTVSSASLVKSVLHAIEHHSILAMGKSDAYVDVLTGLYNQCGLLTVAEAAMDLALVSDSDFAALHIQVGLSDPEEPLTDEHIIKASKLIESSYRANDVLAHVNRAEFVLAMSDANPFHLERIARRLLTQFAVYKQESEDQIPFTVHVGVAHTQNGQSVTLDRLLTEARDRCHRSATENPGKSCVG